MAGLKDQLNKFAIRHSIPVTEKVTPTTAADDSVADIEKEAAMNKDNLSEHTPAALMTPIIENATDGIVGLPASVEQTLQDMNIANVSSTPEIAKPEEADEEVDETTEIEFSDGRVVECSMSQQARVLIDGELVLMTVADLTDEHKVVELIPVGKEAEPAVIAPDMNVAAEKNVNEVELLAEAAKAGLSVPEITKAMDAPAPAKAGFILIHDGNIEGNAKVHEEVEVVPLPIEDGTMPIKHDDLGIHDDFNRSMTLAEALDVVSKDIMRRYGVRSVTPDEVATVMSTVSFYQSIIVDMFNSMCVPVNPIDYGAAEASDLPLVRHLIGSKFLPKNDVRNAALMAKATFTAMQTSHSEASAKLAEMTSAYSTKMTAAERAMRDAENRQKAVTELEAKQQRQIETFNAPAIENPFMLRSTYALTRTAPDAKKTEYVDQRRIFYIGARKGAKVQSSGFYKTIDLTIEKSLRASIPIENAKVGAEYIERIRKFVAKTPDGKHAFADKRGKNVVKHLVVARIGFDIKL